MACRKGLGENQWGEALRSSGSYLTDGGGAYNEGAGLCVGWVFVDGARKDGAGLMERGRGLSAGWEEMEELGHKGGGGA